MKKTIISHFYNEEYLLPWWLSHHKKFFDHGILINYHSTDNSVNIIKEICPEWTIVNTKNKYFESKYIDREILEYEYKIDGWKMCLNTTEFLIGDYSILDNLISGYQLLLGNYVFVDSNLSYLDTNKPIYDQINNGYVSKDDDHSKLGYGFRSHRSIHSKSIYYPSEGGRHFGGKRSTNNLVIFYYAYLIGIQEIIARKIQIQDKMSKIEISKLKPKGPHPNIVDQKMFIDKINKYQRPLCKDMSAEIARLIELQERYLAQKNSYQPLL